MPCHACRIASKCSFVDRNLRLKGHATQYLLMRWHFAKAQAVLRTQAQQLHQPYRSFATNWYNCKDSNSMALRTAQSTVLTRTAAV